jgi:hypothetical protein
MHARAFRKSLMLNFNELRNYEEYKEVPRFLPEDPYDIMLILKNSRYWECGLNEEMWHLFLDAVKLIE